MFVLKKEVPELESWIDLMDFWRAASGRVAPGKVAGLIKIQQPKLFEVEDEPSA